MKAKKVGKIEFDSFAINGYEPTWKNSAKRANFESYIKYQEEMVTNERKNAPASNEIIPSEAYLKVSDKSSAIPVSRAAKSYRSVQSNYLKMYVEDQLLSNPGGDNYDLESSDGRCHGCNETYSSAVIKDLRDAFSNLKNFLLDFTVGAKFKYVDKNGHIQTGRHRGFLHSVGSFFKHLVSGFAFGFYTPENVPQPKGFWGRIKHFFKSIKEALLGDLVEGVGGSVNHMAEDVILGAWNALEVIPDATIGASPQGRKAVSSIFDSGQVVLDYLTDIAPGGDAWMRVHAGNLFKGEVPVVTNLRKESSTAKDLKWRYVRNTPFRKAIETAGTLIADGLSFIFLGRGLFSSDEKRERK